MAGPVSLLQALLTLNRQSLEARRLFGPELLGCATPARPTFLSQVRAAYAEAAGENSAAPDVTMASRQAPGKGLTLDLLRQKANAAQCPEELAILRRQFARLHHPDHARAGEAQSKASAMATANAIIDAAVRRLCHNGAPTQNAIREKA